jgi:hypothetical protein
MFIPWNYTTIDVFGQDLRWEIAEVLGVPINHFLKGSNIGQRVE